MPFATLRGITLHYQVLGDHGPWLAVSPGGRNDMEAIRSVAEKLARAGNRVLIHDRRNCGRSDVSFDDSLSEYEFWADDLHELLRHLDAEPAFIGGSSSGCRLSLLFALRHPRAVRALLLWRLSGGAFGATRLAKQYYTAFIETARQGGMAAVCETPHFKARIEGNPANRDRLMALEPDRFIAVLENWRAVFDSGADFPVFGVTEADLRSIKVPALIIPGADKTHRRQAGLAVHGLIAGSELHELSGEDEDRDVVQPKEWADEDVLVGVIADFVKRASVKRVGAQ